MKDRKLTIGLVRPGAMGGQIGVYDEHANLVRSLTTQHRSDQVISLSSNGNIGTVTYQEQDGRRWVRTYNLENGNIIGNWRLPDLKPMRRAKEEVRLIDLKQPTPHPSEGSGGGVVIAILFFGLIIHYAQTYLIPITICMVMGGLVYLAVNNHDHDNEQ